MGLKPLDLLLTNMTNLVNNRFDAVNFHRLRRAMIFRMNFAGCRGATRNTPSCKPIDLERVTRFQLLDHANQHEGGLRLFVGHVVRPNQVKAFAISLIAAAG